MRLCAHMMVAGLALAVLAAVAAGYAGPLSHTVDAIAHFRPQLAIAAAFIGAIALSLRAWRPAGWALSALVIAAAGIPPLLENRPASTTQAVPQAGHHRLVIMTANLHHLNPAPDAMRSALVAADADILVTHETTKAAQAGSESLARLYPYRISLVTQHNVLRTVIWSRFPMRDGWLLLEDRVHSPGAAATIELPDGTEIGVLGIHLARPATPLQDIQITSLDRIVPKLHTPLVVVGDMNATPWSSALRRVEAATGARRIPGYRVTWRGHYPSPLGPIWSPIGQPIDHILVPPGIGVADIRTVEIPGSDHLAVRAVLQVPKRALSGLPPDDGRG